MATKIALVLLALCRVSGHTENRAKVPNGYVNDKATGHNGASPFRFAFRDIGG